MVTTILALLALLVLMLAIGNTLCKRLKRLILAQGANGDGRQALAENTLLASAHADAHAKGFGHAFEEEMAALKSEHGRLIRIGDVIAAYRNARAASKVGSY